MKPEYQDWITKHCQETYGKCAKHTEDMQLEFPELSRIRGHYYCTTWGERAHWWLTDTDGTIIDPTAAQFPSKGKGHYEPWDDTNPEPTGMCPNCGEYCYGNNYLCSDECQTAYAAYIMNPNSY